MALSTWLRKTSKNADSVGHYYYEQRSRDDHVLHDYRHYYAFWLRDVHVRRQINQYSEILEKQGYITKKDPETGQNAFHTLFLEKELFTFPSSYNNDDYVIFTSNAQERIKKCQKNNGSKKACKSLTTLHQELLEAKELLPLKDFKPIDQANRVLALVVEPFKDKSANEQLTQALLAKDKQGNTALFYFCTYYDNNKNYTPLVNRISQLNLEQKKRLLYELNQNGKTVLHKFAEHFAFVPCKNIFDEKAIKEGLCSRDTVNLDTPLHTTLKRDDYLERGGVYDGRNRRTVWVESICRLAQEQLQEEKNSVLYLENLFCQNRQRLNPLHLLCQLSPSEDNLPLLQKMLGILTLPKPGNSHEEKKHEDTADEEAEWAVVNMHVADKETSVTVSAPPQRPLHMRKLMERDELGCTPLHYAIKTCNTALVEEILKCLNGELLLNMVDKDGKTVLHYACQYGDRATQEQIVKAVGPLGVYLTRRSKVGLANSTESVVEDVNRLFNAFDYFVNAKVHDQDFTDRLEDFYKCVRAIENARESGSNNMVMLPEENANFLSKGRGIRKTTEGYHTLRTHFPRVTLKEAQEFKIFIDSLGRSSVPSYETGGSVRSPLFGAFFASVEEKRKMVAGKLVAMRAQENAQQPQEALPLYVAPPIPLSPPSPTNK